MGEQHREESTGQEPELKRQKSSGSVKRARERAAAGLPPERRDPLEPAPLRITPNRTPPRATTPSEQPFRSHLQTEASPSSQGSTGTTPTTPHWPPTSDPIPGRERPNSPIQESKTPRGPPPKRPPRPDYVPPLPAQNPGQGSQNYWENDFIASSDGGSRSPGRPGAGLPTTGVPEFPIPFTPQTSHQPRRNLGPPPSARKGGANFYPQNAFVAPIPEEQSESHSSFASSHVMPSSWVDGPPEYYMGSGISEEDEDEVQSPSSTNDGRDSRAGDHDESTGLVRKVSIGRPGKPALKQVKGEGDDGDEKPRAGQEVQFGPGAGVATFLAPSSNHNSPAATPGEKVADYEKDLAHSYSGTASPITPVDPRVAKILGGLEKGGALSTAATTPMTSTQPSMSDKGGKRPTRLNLAGVQQSEPRGSATSLPELIRRATRLASNLDRGRTASRIGMLEMLDKENSKHPSRSGSISDILAAFPTPSLHTPQAQSTSIVRLLTSANSNYSIPLKPSVILSLFSFQNLTCTSENALVTFNGKPQRKRDSIPSSPSPLTPRKLQLVELLANRHPTRASLLDARAIAKRASAAQAAVTSNGIVFAAPSGAGSDTSPKSTPSSSPSSSSAATSPASLSQSPSPSSSNTNTNPSASSSSSTSRPLTPNVLDFARAAVLFIFQERDLATAVSAQVSMQAVFSPGSSSASSSSAFAGGSRNFNASVSDVGSGIHIDWGRLSVDFGNGTEFGGRGEG
ncbi:MAG: hypothetical protein LQ338_006960 [Usnochroma carphineum]|nr:MAG: hypothetical protein LQ338_006960 [Usnochroma carphineum]